MDSRSSAGSSHGLAKSIDSIRPGGSRCSACVVRPPAAGAGVGARMCVRTSRPPGTAKGSIGSAARNVSLAHGFPSSERGVSRSTCARAHCILQRSECIATQLGFTMPIATQVYIYSPAQRVRCNTGGVPPRAQPFGDGNWRRRRRRLRRVVSGMRRIFRHLLRPRQRSGE